MLSVLSIDFAFLERKKETGGIMRLVFTLGLSSLLAHLLDFGLVGVWEIETHGYGQCSGS